MSDAEEISFSLRVSVGHVSLPAQGSRGRPSIPGNADLPNARTSCLLINSTQHLQKIRKIISENWSQRHPPPQQKIRTLILYYLIIEKDLISFQN